MVLFPVVKTCEATRWRQQRNQKKKQTDSFLPPIIMALRGLVRTLVIMLSSREHFTLFCSELRQGKILPRQFLGGLKAIQKARLEGVKCVCVQVGKAGRMGVSAN